MEQDVQGKGRFVADTIFRQSERVVGVFCGIRLVPFRELLLVLQSLEFVGVVGDELAVDVEEGILKAAGMESVTDRGLIHDHQIAVGVGDPFSVLMPQDLLLCGHGGEEREHVPSGGVNIFLQRDLIEGLQCTVGGLNAALIHRTALSVGTGRVQVRDDEGLDLQECQQPLENLGIGTTGDAGDVLGKERGRVRLFAVIVQFFQHSRQENGFRFALKQDDLIGKEDLGTVHGQILLQKFEAALLIWPLLLVCNGQLLQIFGDDAGIRSPAEILDIVKIAF